jgi:methylated-DNA-[protein]-cysteine S-methyltransferase
MQLLIDRIASPIGAIDIVAADGKLIGLEFVDARDRMTADLTFRFGDVALKRARNPFDIGARLRAYFAGDIAAIDDIAVESGGTPFQRRVWAALRRIPVGSTVTYSDLARAAGRPQAIRAAGAANGRNPISIVVPCHRVIGRDGTLTGYGGGLHRKAWLLRHEGVSLPA